MEGGVFLPCSPRSPLRSPVLSFCIPVPRFDLLVSALKSPVLRFCMPVPRFDVPVPSLKLPVLQFYMPVPRCDDHLLQPQAKFWSEWANFALQLGPADCHEGRLARHWRVLPRPCPVTLHSQHAEGKARRIELVAWSGPTSPSDYSRIQRIRSVSSKSSQPSACANPRSCPRWKVP